jgi:hypothetical protein
MLAVDVAVLEVFVLLDDATHAKAGGDAALN